MLLQQCHSEHSCIYTCRLVLIFKSFSNAVILSEIFWEIVRKMFVCFGDWGVLLAFSEQDQEKLDVLQCMIRSYKQRLVLASHMTLECPVQTSSEK